MKNSVHSPFSSSRKYFLPVLVLCLLFSLNSTSQETLVASCDQYEQHATNPNGQSFKTTSLTGYGFYSIEVFSAVANNNVTLEIHEGEGYGGSVIYTQSGISIADGGGSGTFTKIVLSSNPPFTADSWYTVKLTHATLNVSVRGDGDGRNSLAMCGFEGDRYDAAGSPVANSDWRIKVERTTNPLPVELVHFMGVTSKDEVVLTWQTASEIDNHGFEVERSNTGQDWETIAFIEGAGTSFETQTYSYIDDTPPAGLNYYRLKQIDFDGAYEYSKTVSVEVGNENKSMFFTPNPGEEGSTVTLKISSEKFEAGTLILFDLTGKAVLSQDIATSNPVIDVSGLSKGIYYATLTSGRVQMVEKLLIE